MYQILPAGWPRYIHTYSGTYGCVHINEGKEQWWPLPVESGFTYKEGGMNKTALMGKAFFLWAEDHLRWSSFIYPLSFICLYLEFSVFTITLHKEWWIILLYIEGKLQPLIFTSKFPLLPMCVPVVFGHGAGNFLWSINPWRWCCCTIGVRLVEGGAPHCVANCRSVVAASEFKGCVYTCDLFAKHGGLHRMPYLLSVQKFVVCWFRSCRPLCICLPLFLLLALCAHHAPTGRP